MKRTSLGSCLIALFAVACRSEPSGAHPTDAPDAAAPPPAATAAAPTEAPLASHRAEAVVDALRAHPALSLASSRPALERTATGFRVSDSPRGFFPARLTAEAPAQADAALHVGSVDPGAFVELRALGDGSGAASRVDNALVHLDAAPGLHVVRVLEPSRVEELRILTDARAPSVFRSTVRLGPSISALRSTGDTLEAVDALGRVRLATDPAFAVDASGTRRAVRFEVDGDMVVTRLDTTGLVYPVLIDPVWTARASLNTPRAGAVIARMPSGKVLVAGGFNGSSGLSSAEVYDPTANTWTLVTNNLSAPSGSGAAAATLTNGKVLVISQLAANADVYDPVANKFTPTGALNDSRGYMGLAALPSGKALAIGGNVTGLGVDSSTEIYDAATNGWTLGNSMATARSSAPTVTLSGGDLLVMGGNSATGTKLSSVERYAIATGTWSTKAPLKAPRIYGSAAVLTDGTVLLAGGYGTGDVERYDPVVDAWSVDASAPMISAYFPGVYAFGTGRALVLPGMTRIAQVFDSASSSWATGGTMNVLRYETFMGTTLLDGSVLIVGGANDSSNTMSLSSTEQYVAAANGTTCGAAGECASFFCVDGVCCDKACNGQCEACDGAVKGTCAPVTGAPHGSRTACSGTGVGTTCGIECNGSDATKCNYPTSTTSCGSASCSGTTELHPGHCDGAGACADTPSSCSPYVCGATSCKTTCATKADCDTGFYCNAGACVPGLAAGAACTSADSCGTAGCVDGVCCNATSCPTGSACNNAGSKGTCSKNRGQGCTMDAECGSGHCADGVCCDTACTGTCSSCASVTPGTCSPVSGSPTHGSCAPYVACVSGACASSCSTDADCNATSFCNKGTCVARQANGATCTGGDGCASGFCVDGRCCDRACNGQCEACDVASKEGTCTNVTDAPHGMRMPCSTASCASGVFTPAGVCDSATGVCKAATAQTCFPYQCSATGCATKCATASDCQSGFSCNGSACVPDTAAGTCSGDGTSSTAKDGTVTQCGVYRCAATGVCGQSCGSSADCATGATCDSTGKCVGAPSTTASSGGCAWSSGSNDGRSKGTWAMLVTLATAVLARARRRRSGRGVR
jgi:hypothetical protein